MQLSSVYLIVINVIFDYFSILYSHNFFSIIIMLNIYALGPSQILIKTILPKMQFEFWSEQLIWIFAVSKLNFVRFTLNKY